ncbi:MAG: hypothetical protein JST39_01490, partial [Bacteroidetes bacterium]|nr:hypothetical protein [Bacteroidota bacterium]
RMDISGPFPPYPYKGTVTGDVSGKPSYTGGWINRFSCKRFFAGLDLLYYIDEHVINNSVNGQLYKKTSLDLQNIYAGMRVPVAGHETELYINSRNPWQNHDSDITDGRRYYGAGFKVLL